MQPLGDFEACFLQILKNMGGKILGYNIKELGNQFKISRMELEAKEDQMTEVLKENARLQDKIKVQNLSKVTQSNCLLTVKN